MDKMRMESVDITDQNIETIGALFPNVITETKDENGKLVKAINFELLKQELSKEVIEGDEVYEFTWVGKKAAIVEANKPIRKTLRPNKAESVNWDTTENLYIEGDNLEVLKLLQESYLGKVKMIYIDPPYNTGHDFIYPDSFVMDSEDYNEGTGYFNEDGDVNFSRKNGSSAGKYHSDWCSMIYSRLVLARNLLSDSGLIFISIDDNEQANLKKICDDVFGEANFLNSIIWRYTSGGIPEDGKFSSKHDTILLYAKSMSTHKINIPLEKSYSQTIPEPHTESGIRLGVKRDDTCEYCGNAPGGKYREVVMRDVWNDINSLFRNNYEKKMLEEMGVSFDTQKPIKLLERIIESGSDDGDLILDFFSGSASTAHAVMDINANSSGSRKYIMVQLQEQCGEKTDAFKSGYENICEIGKERIRRAAMKIHEEHPNAKFDDGFRVLKVDESNMTDVYYSADSYDQNMLNQLESNIKSDRTDIDLLFGCLLEWGLPLSMPYVSEDIEGYKVHTYNDGDLIACFDKNVPESVIKEIAKRKPLRAVFRDSSFKGSPEKINVGETFKLLSPDTRVKII